MTPTPQEVATIAKLKKEFPTVWNAAMKEAQERVELIALEFCRAIIRAAPHRRTTT